MRPRHPIDRRGALRLLTLSALAVTAAAPLAACGSESGGARHEGSYEPMPGGVDVEPVAADVPRADGDADAVSDVVAALRSTGGALLGLLGEQPGNLAISPYSVLVALALTLNGARGATLEQLLGLYDGLDVGRLNGGLNALTAEVEGQTGEVEKADGTPTELVLDAANGLFGQRGTAWEQAFLDVLAAQYGAALQTVDWAGDTEAARQAVNAWTAERTRDKIPEILPAGAVDALTRLVLVNTLYLEAPWERPFSAGLTEDADFTRPDGSTVGVPMMRSAEPVDVAWSRGEGWQAVRLPYAGGTTAMTVVLPDAGRLADVQADVAAGGLTRYLEAGTTEPVDVRMPSFTFRTGAGLVEPLRRLGVTDAFDEGRADLTGMTTEERLFVSGVLHQVFVAVDEEGTEAAAATAVAVGATSAPAAPRPFTVDRPFLFVVHDVEHGTPLFLGRVDDPTAGE
ncbi:serpin family protein [Nocardioides marinquilinus]|uniref:Serpin family protein n=1 Tax=Nocardioides marinquilinus TaxID=1210400 RepID=A0ABP9Q4Z6_9ACTN